MTVASGMKRQRSDYDIEAIRREFPILRETVHGKPLVYLDNAATTQKPQSVIDAIVHYYLHDNSNVHRGVHLLSERATADYEAARVKIQHFLNASSEKEIIFTRGCTEAINLVMYSWGRSHVGPGDEIVISAIEHHSNIVPWQMLCEEKGAVLRVIPVNEQGELVLDEYEKVLCERTRLVAISHVSNALGTINPIRTMIEMAHAHGAPVLIDGAQGVPHLKVDVQALDCDFYAFSGHKVYAPTGIGALYAKRRWLEAMPPFQGGGDMILSVTFGKTIYNEIPYKFEAGTPNISGAIGLGAALDYVSSIGLDAIAAWEHDLLAYATARLTELPEVKLIGTAAEKASVVSFVLDGIHPHDIGTIVDQEGVAIRTGHHCAQPVMRRYGLAATARCSLALYNTPEEIDALVRAIRRVLEVFG
ncbi:MAG TPA: cysteine desulfurase [Thermoanaerobaculia bacterium]|nr:cysteine desulfurase [Thermoanaerobaculia bacterium]